MLRDMEIRRSDGIILVYSVDDKDSFTKLEMLCKQILENQKQKWAPIVIVSFAVYHCIDTSKVCE